MPRTGAPKLALAVVLTVLATAVPARAATRTPIPQGPGAGDLPAFTGAPATPRPVVAPEPPRHPHMAPNGRSNIHDDAYQTDTYQGWGPLGRGGITTRSAFGNGECASITFDSRGRIVTVCVGLAGPMLRMLDPVTLDELATFTLPPRLPDSGNPFTNFAGGGYFYLDDRDRAVVPTTTRHLLVVAERADGAPGFVQQADHDLTGAVPAGDQIVSALPDWSGRLWFASRNGVVGTVDPRSGTVASKALGEPIGNSFAVDETGGVFIVSDAALYRFEAGPGGAPRVTWREPYANIGTVKPGQTQAGSGTTPTLMRGGFVVITDNADPMNVVVLRRDAAVPGSRRVCTIPVFDKGASDTDQSLIVAGRAIVVENNYGYSGPTATQGGRSTTGGLQRVDVDRDGRGCHTVWRSAEVAPSVVPKLSLAAGLVYTYTKDPRSDGQDAWYLTALDFRSGRTVFKRLGGEGLGFNNNYAPITLGPDGTAYLGVLGGIVSWRDNQPPPLPRRPVRLRLHATCAWRAKLTGADVHRVRRVAFTKRGRVVARDRRRPFAAKLPHSRRERTPRRIGARVRLGNGRRVRLAARARRCS